MELFKIFGTIAVNNDEANREIDETTGRAQKSESKLTAAFKKIGTAVAAAFAIDKIKDFGLATLEAAANAEATAAQFSQVFGNLESTASKNLSTIAKDAGVLENRLKGSYTKIAAFAKTTGMETADALALSDRAMVAIADSAAFYDRSIEEVTESLQSFLKGNYANDAALGLSATETTRNAAANKLYAKSFNELSESEKQFTLLRMVEDANELSGAIGQAARESETWTNQTGNLQQAWTDFKAVIGSKFLEKAVNVLTFLVGATQNLTKLMNGETVPAFAKFQPIIDKVSQGFQFLQRVFAPVFDTLKQTVEENLPKWKESFSKFRDAIDACRPIFKLLGQAIALAVGIIIGAVNGLINAFSGIVDVVSGVVEYVGGLFDFFTGLLTGDFSLMQRGAEKCVNGIVKVFGGLYDAVYGFLKGFVDGVISFFTSLWDELVGHSIVPDTINAIIDWFAKLPSKVLEKLRQLYSNVTGEFGNIKNSISNHLNGAKTIIFYIFDEIRNKIVNTINNAKTTVSNGTAAIKSFFDNMKLKFPNIKLPHFTIKGNFSLSPLSVPKIAIDWYAKAMNDGMIMNAPTIFGINGKGQLMGGGEAGSEAVVGTNSLNDMIQAAVNREMTGISESFEKLISILLTYFPELAANKTIVLDSGALVGELAPKIDGALGDINRMKVRGI